MSKTYYSTDEEFYNYESIHECMDQFEVGETVTVYSGTSVKKLASDFCEFGVDNLEEIAYDRAGDFAESWLQTTGDMDIEFKSMVKDAVDAWATKHDMHPKFYGIKDVQTITLKVLPDGEYDILKGNDD